MNSPIHEIESKSEIIAAANVLKELEKRGLAQPAIASGWIRGFLTGTKPSDIDIAYVGDVHYDAAQKYLKEIISELHLEHMDWDVTGIWNAQMKNPSVTTTERNYLLFYVCSIDSVYLASDGKLHDATGFGFEDASNKILRMNDFTAMNFQFPNDEIVYFCLEGCRRIVQFKWTPTEHSVELIKSGTEKWLLLSDTEKQYFYKRLMKKYTEEEMLNAQKIYERYGWGFVFDLALNARNKQ
jgi:hypothetical protein